MTRFADIIARAAKLSAAVRFERLSRVIRRSGAFDTLWYKAVYPESAGWDASVHYLAIGAAKGYKPHLLFDPQWWSEMRGSCRHPIPFVDYLEAPERWSLSPSPYLVIRPGLEATQMPSHTSPLGLWQASAGREGLAHSPLFDTDFYTKNNPDTAEAGLDPLLHFVSNGGREGRSPCVSFDAFWYLSVNPDVKAQDEEPLRHFLLRGARQARSTHRAIELPTLRANSPAASTSEAIAYYQSNGRHRLSALTHPRLPPPGGVASLLDDWPWQNRTPAMARGRLLVVITRELSLTQKVALQELAASPTTPEPWLVTLDSAASNALISMAIPLLDLSTAPAALPALLRAAALAGPNLKVAIDGDPDHPACGDATAAGFVVTTLADIPPPRNCPAQPRTEAEISVVVPSYNHSKYLDVRLTSILAQRRTPCEIIIIDDASQDDSQALAQGFAENAPLPVRVIARNRNSGSPFTSWAEGALQARGELLWIAESDDVAHPRLLERLAPFLDSDPETVFAYCQSAVIGARGERLADDHLFYTDDIDAHRWECPYNVPGEEEIVRALAIKNTIPNASAVLFRREKLAEIVPQIVADRYCGDWRAYALLAARGRIGYSPESLNQARRHWESVTAKGERALTAIRESQDIRLQLWRFPGVPTGTIRASFAQHLREVESRNERHSLATTRLDTREIVRPLREAMERLLRETTVGY